MSLDNVNPSHEESLNNFIEYFKSDMTDFLRNNTHKNKFRSVVVGGYGLKLLLDNNYNLENKVKSKDLDITVSSYKSAYNDEQITQYIMNKIITFVRSQPNPKDYKVSIIQGSLYVPILNYTRKAIIMISYKYQEFVDIAITDAKIVKTIIDKPNSIKCGLPLKTINEYLLELLTIIYRANVLNVSPELYEKRNPVSGYQSQKGIQDIDRAKLICSLPQLRKYRNYCNFINKVSKTKLFATSPEERSSFFSALKSLLSLKRKIIKRSLHIDKNTSQKVFI
jgi:hypothetical protein